MSRVEMHSQAPEFQVEDYLGNSVSLSQFEGQFNVLLVFNRGFA